MFNDWSKYGERMEMNEKNNALLNCNEMTNESALKVRTLESVQKKVYIHIKYRRFTHIA